MTRSSFAFLFLCALGSFALTGPARAADSGTGLAVVAGAPTGIGLEITQRLHPAFNVRLGGGLSTEGTADDIELGSNKYSVDLEFGGANALLDWHPWKGNFRVSTGVFILRNDTAFERTKGPYLLNGTSYSSAQVSSIDGVLHLDRTVTPAFLIGWGNTVKPGRKLGFQIELGLAYAGDTKTTLTAKGPLATDPTLLKNLEAEARKIDDDGRALLSGVLRLGVTYQF